ncbi:arginase [Brumimicrobium salinarum]|uniref:Arginase n=1 Tax=Brumimicrobium salinarum TaxID=2058658 RepID=A0A2I0R1U7_9FLAO|nr:formimidoylglutamase [Brumimicrobium salinarum]PKR80553.1 arginase [Brumimicrobium salinarum]
MKDISLYFQPVGNTEEKIEDSLHTYINIYQEEEFPTLDKKGVAIFHVPEYRNDTHAKEKRYKNEFRNKLYRLFSGSNWEHTIYDLGNIAPGKHINDTFHAIETVCEELIKKEIIPIVVGGTHDLTNAIYNTYGKLEQLVNLTVVDHKIDLGDANQQVKSDGWLSHLLLQKPCYLFNFANIGLQGHYTSKNSLKLFEELYFDVTRLGDISSNITLAEPQLRNTDLLSFDLNSIRASDLQNENYSSPNGVFAHEACQIMRYAGISDKLTSVGVFNYFSENHQVTDELLAQLIWYFNEGYANRKGDFPIGSKKSYTKYRVFLEELNEEILFYKSDKSSRWWIEVPYPGTSKSKFLRHQMVPCDYNTYQEAMKGEIPDVWWKTYQKFV